ncbi:MAG TPA: endonuclease/exonuclease/phosphatase family protein, partial [Planctomycetaceae bacterium]|nr:endonuclease/exonuclease/phosphatase family protein [Planctomycetaceae bacterium]
VDQPNELARLTGMQVVFGANIKLQSGHYGNVILSKFPIIRSRNHLLPCFDNGEQRGVLESDIALPTGVSLKFLATHFDYRPNDAERLASAAAIQTLIQDPDERPALLAGDLNDTIGSPTLDFLLKEWSRTSDEVQPTIPVSKPAQQIDFVLFRPAARWHVVESKVLDESVASDHRPILAVLELLPEVANGR